MLYLAYRYLDTPAQGLIANANLGGDNCHRGSLLGAILGCATASPDFLDGWRKELHLADEFNHDVSRFANLCATAATDAAAAPAPLQSIVAFLAQPLEPAASAPPCGP